jgi:hypothetical protein
MYGHAKEQPGALVGIHIRDCTWGELPDETREWCRAAYRFAVARERARTDDYQRRLEVEKRHVAFLEAELRDARATIAAWEPVVVASLEWANNLSSRGVTPEGGPIKRFCDAVDALPAELRPTASASDPSTR